MCVCVCVCVCVICIHHLLNLLLVQYIILFLPTSKGNPSTYKTLNFTFNQGNLVAYYNFDNSSTSGIDSSSTDAKYTLTSTIRVVLVRVPFYFMNFLPTSFFFVLEA